MKYLQDYIEDKQTKLFKETGTFFCFSQSQFNEQKKEGVKYVDMGGGMVCNKDHVEKLINGLDLIYKNGIQEDLKENGKEGVILRELANHEAWYTRDIQSTVEALDGYGFTEGQILLMFKNKKTKLQSYE